MKKCPKCEGEIAYKKLLFLMGYQIIECGHCGSLLSTNKLKMTPFALIITILSALFGLTYASTDFSTRWLVIIIVFLVVVFLITPFVTMLKIDKSNK